jgi:hypothetical protein
MVRGDRRSAMILSSGGSARRARPGVGRAATCSRAAAVVAVFGILAAGLLVTRGARAERAYDFLPSASVGVTDNASAASNKIYVTDPLDPTKLIPVNNPNRRADGFVTLSATGRAHALTMHSDNSLGLRVSDTFYILGYGPTALMIELAGVSALSTWGSALQLRLAAGLTYGKTSSPTRADINSALPTVLPANANPYVSGTASEEALYSWSPRTRLFQSLRFAGVDYLNHAAPAANSAGLPPVNFSFVVGGTLRLERDFLDNLFLLEGNLADSVVPNRSDQIPGLADQVLLTELLAGWRRDFGIAWSAEVKAGALGVFDSTGTHIIEPAGSAAVGYRQLYWFAQLTGFHSVVPNVFIAAATISDSVQLRFALPLGRSERYYALGFGGYSHARLADSQGTHRAYDLWTAGASLTARSEKYPIWGSLDYMVSTQTGNQPEGGAIPDIDRMALILTVGGAFTTGREQPPIFHGVMGAIRPLSEQNSGSPVGPTSYGTGGVRETPGAPGWSGSGGPESDSGLSGSKSKKPPAQETPGAPGWSGTPTTTETPGAPGWSGSQNQSGQGSGNVDNVTR